LSTASPGRLLLDVCLAAWALLIAAQYLGGQLLDAIALAAGALG